MDMENIRHDQQCENQPEDMMCNCEDVLERNQDIVDDIAIHE